MRNDVRIQDSLTMIHFSDMDIGQMYQLISGAAVYMKISGGYSINLATGERYSLSGEKNVRPIQTGVDVGITQG